jgi:large subunit ribosomal protein L21
MNGVDINDVVQLNRVLLVGTPKATLIGRPFVDGVKVIASVEEHIRDSTVYIFKRKRASGYRRFRGFRAVCVAPLVLVCDSVG